MVELSLHSPKRVLVWTGACTGLGVGGWFGYRLISRHWAAKAAAAAQTQGREIAQNTELILAALHDGPYSFMPPGTTLGSDEDTPLGPDDLDAWRAAESLSTTMHSSGGASSQHSSDADDEGDARAVGRDVNSTEPYGSVLWSMDGGTSQLVAPLDASDAPLGHARRFDSTADDSSTATGGTGGTWLRTQNLATAAPPLSAFAEPKNPTPRRRRVVKAIISGVVAVLSSSEEDEREVEKVEVQQAVMNVSSKSFLHWAVGNHPANLTPSRSVATGSMRGLASPPPYVSDGTATFASPQAEPSALVPSTVTTSGLPSTPYYPFTDDHTGAYSAYHARQASQLSTQLALSQQGGTSQSTSSPAGGGLLDRHNHILGEDDGMTGSVRWTPATGSFDAHGGVYNNPGADLAAGTVPLLSTAPPLRRRRPWWRRLLRIVRRASLTAWHRFVKPCLVRPLRHAWHALVVTWHTTWTAMREGPRRLAASLSGNGRRRTTSTASAKPADPVEAFLAPDSVDAVDVEAALQEIVDLMKPSAAHPARVPTVAVIRVPIGYEASLETERLVAALQLDSSSREDGLVDLYVIEELKTACLSLPPAAPASQSHASPTMGLHAVNEDGAATLWGRRQSSQNLSGDMGVARLSRTASGVADAAETEKKDLADLPSPRERSTTHRAGPSPLPSSAATPLPETVQGPSNAATPPSNDSSLEDEESVEDPASRLKLTYEVYPATVFYSFVLRAAVFQLKDDVTREAAAKVFGGDPSSALLPEHSLATGYASAAEGSRTPPPTPFMTCVSPMCAPYPAPPLPGGVVPPMPPSVSAFNLTSPSSRVFSAAGPTAGATAGDSSPPSPASVRTGRSTSMVFIDAMESLQSGATDSAFSAARRTAGRTDTPQFPPSLPPSLTVPLPSCAATSSSFQGNSCFPSTSSHGPVHTVHRPSYHRRVEDEPWGVCCMTVHVRSADTRETDKAGAAYAASPTSGTIGPFTLPPSVLVPRALQSAQPRSSIDSTSATAAAIAAASSATFSPPLHSAPTPPTATLTVHTAGTAATTTTTTTTATNISRGSPSFGPAPTPLPPPAASSSSTCTPMAEEPEVRVRYRTRLVSGGSHSKPALEKVNGLLSRLRKQWWELLLPLMQEAATPISSASTQVPVHSHSLRDYLDISPRLRPWSPHVRSPAPLPPHRVPPSSPGPLDAHAGSPLLPPAVPKSPVPKTRLAQLGFLASPLIPHTPDLRATTVPGMGESSLSRLCDARLKVALHLPTWALNSVLRRESMRETLMKELKERAFRILSIPLPDARVYRQLPPDVPRYIAAHARGFALAHSFAQEIVNQQRHLQRILIGLEQRHQQLQIKREQRHRRRHKAWQALHGFFSLERSQSRPGEAGPHHPRGSTTQTVGRTAAHHHKSADESDSEDDADDNVDVHDEDAAVPPQSVPPASTSWTSSLTGDAALPNALNATCRGLPPRSSSQSTTSLAAEKDGAGDGGLPQDTTTTTTTTAAGAAATTHSAGHVGEDEDELATPPLVTLGTPLALSLLEPSLPLTENASMVTSVAVHEAAAAAAASSAAAAIMDMTCGNDSSGHGSGAGASGVSGGTGGGNAEAALLSVTSGASASFGAGSSKRQGWTTTNTSTNYNVDGKPVSPGASLVGSGLTPGAMRGVACNSASPPTTSLSPPTSVGASTPGWSPANALSPANSTTEHVHGLLLPPSAKSRGVNGTPGTTNNRDAWNSPPAQSPARPNSRLSSAGGGGGGGSSSLGDATPSAATMNMPGVELSTPTSSNRQTAHTWTPLSSTNDADENSSRLSQRPLLLAPNNSMYGTFDAYFGQSIASPQAVLMRHQAAGIRHHDAATDDAPPRHHPHGRHKATDALTAGRDDRPPNRAVTGASGGTRRPLRGSGDSGGSMTAPSSYTTMPHSGEARGSTRVGGGRARTGRGWRRTYGSAAALPYNYSSDSVTSVLGTNHYPLYQMPREHRPSHTAPHASSHARTDSAAAASSVDGRDRIVHYQGVLHDLLGSGGGAMSSGITYYYTFGNATASLFNSCLRPTPESDPWERVLPAPGARRSSTAPCGVEAHGASMATTYGSPLSRQRSAASAPSPHPPASAPPQTVYPGGDDTASSYLFMEPDEPDSSDEMVEEQTVLRQSRNQMFYSVYRHLHRAFVDTITKEATPSSAWIGTQSVSTGGPRFGPAVPPDTATRAGAGGASSLPTMPTSAETETVTLGAHTVARSALDTQNGHYGLEPLQVWLATRYSRRFAAEVYIMDVAACKSDRHYPAARVLDEVVEHAVLYYHDRRFSEFVEELHAHFGLSYTPRTRWGRFTMGFSMDEEEVMHTVEDPDKRDYSGGAESALHHPSMASAELDDAPPLSAAVRRVVDMQRRCGGVCERAQEEDEGLFFSAFEPTEPLQVNDAHDERLLLRELDYVKEFLLENHRVLCSALQTDSGANSLEEVFGVPAMVFAFILCARESVALMDTVYHGIEGHYGRLTLDNFTHFTQDVFAHDRPHITRHVTRIFRVLDKGRRGFFEYDELCWYMARKLSCGNNLAPDAHLLATAMSLRLPFILIIDQKYRWPDLLCTLTSLSDGEVDY